MTRIILVIAALVFCGFSNAQSGTDEKAHFVYPISEMDSLVLDIQMFPGEAMLDIVSVQVPLKFVIEADGSIGPVLDDTAAEIDLSGYTRRPRNKKALLHYFVIQAKEICARTGGLWVPTIENGEFKSDTMYYVFNFKTERSGRLGKEKVFFGGNNFVDTYYDQTEDLSNYSIARIYNKVAETMTDAELGMRLHSNATKYVQRNELLIAELLIDVAKIKLQGNIDMLYDRGVIKLKLGKKIEACDSFTEGYQYGDLEAGNLLEQYCK